MMNLPWEMPFTSRMHVCVVYMWMQVWAFDASKQMVGAGFAHVANLLIAILLYNHQMEAQVMKGVDQVPCTIFISHLL
jgi:hypothetical protein